MKVSTISPTGCKILAFALAAISSLFPAHALANVFDYSNSGIVKGSSGQYYLVEGSKVTQIPESQALKLQHKFPIATSKGPQQVEFVRGTTAHLPKVGNAVGTFAKRVGPVGVALATADLICELSNICNQAGQWMMSGTDPLPGQPNSYPVSDGKWWGWDQRYYSTIQAACSDSVRLTVNVGAGSIYDHNEYVNDVTYKCFAKHPNGNVFYASNTTKSTGCANGYTLNGTTCEKTGSTQSHPATAQDWTNAETALNDQRFVPDLIAANEKVPIELPTMAINPIRQQISKTSEPTMNSNGTQTGTKEQLTELVLTDASTTDKPNQIDVKEETTTTYRDINGAVIGTITTSTTEVNQQQPTQTQSCGLPGQEPCNVLVDERGVQAAIDTLTPLGQTATQNVTSAFDAADQSILTRSGGVGQGFAWPWEINAGSCSPLVIDAQKGLVIDICPHIPLIHQILSYVFYVLTAIAIFNVFFQPKTT